MPSPIICYYSCPTSFLLELFNCSVDFARVYERGPLPGTEQHVKNAPYWCRCSFWVISGLNSIRHIFCKTTIGLILSNLLSLFNHKFLMSRASCMKLCYKTTTQRMFYIRRNFQRYVTYTDKTVIKKLLGDHCKLKRRFRNDAHSKL